MKNLQPPFTITNEILLYVASISEKIGRITAVCNLEAKPHLRKNNRIRSIHSSLRIEANSLSLGQVRAVINGKNVLGDQKEIQEVKNAYGAYQRLPEIDPYSLKQLKKSGRVSAAAAFAGELLGLRPIISLTDGVSHVEAKVRGDAAVIPAMLKWVSTRVDDMRDTPYMMAYTSSTQKRDELLKLCKKEFGHPPMHIFQLGGVVSANTGPDCIAIAFEGKPRRLAGYEPPLP